MTSGKSSGGSTGQRAVLSIEQYAEVQAHIAHFDGAARPPTLLAQLGLREDLWSQAKSHWLAAIRAEMEDDAAPLATAFGRSFALTRADLARRKPRLEDVDPLVAPPAVGRDFNPVEETALALATADEDALPFVASALAKPPPPQAANLPAAPDAGETQEVSILGPGLLAALPFSRGRGADLSRMSLSQYASLHAELGAQPQARVAILGRYALTEETCAELDSAWRERFAAHPEDQQRFGELVSLYGSWLRGTEPAGGR